MKSYFDNIKNILLTVFLFIVFVLTINTIGAQVFQVQGRTYKFADGRWFNFTNGHKGDPIIPNHLIVRLKNRGNLRNYDFSQLGLSRIQVITQRLLGDYFGLYVSDTQDPFYIANLLAENSDFDYVEFDAWGIALNSPNDDLYQFQWNMPKVDMPDSWDITTGNNEIILAIIDYGFQIAHEDLCGNVWLNPNEDDGDGIPEFSPIAQGGDEGDLNGDGFPGIKDIDDDGDGLIDEDSQGREPGDPNYTNDLKDDDDENGFNDDLVGWDYYDILSGGDNNPNPQSQFAHGTAVAGIAGAMTNNSMGVAGVAGGWIPQPGVSLMNLRHHHYDHFNGALSVSSCINYAVNNGAKVINMSLAFSDHYQHLFDACSTAAELYDCLLIAGAGNNGGDGSSNKSIRWPARYSYTIAVGATVQDDSRWTSGGDYGSAFGPELDLMAPGGEPTIYTTDNMGSAGYDPGNYHSSFGGTSASTPVVAGVAALIRSLDPSLGWQQVREILRNTADKVAGMGGNNFHVEYGYGRANAYQALLRTLAEENKSTASNATYSNSARHMVKGSGYVHEVFTSGGEIFYRRSSDGGLNFNLTKRISLGNDYNKNASITYWDGYLHTVWERQIGADEFEIWFSKSNAENVSWTSPIILPSAIVHTGTYKPGAMPVISFIDSQNKLIVVYCANNGLYYRISYDQGNSWSIPANEQIFFTYYSVRYPSISRGDGFLSLVYWLGNVNGVFSRIFDGSEWSSETHIADITGTWYNRTPSVSIDPEGNILAAWRGQVYDGGLDPYYSILFRSGYADNTWSSWFSLFYHDPNITYHSPSISYYNKGGGNPYGIGIVYATTDDDIKIIQYSGDQQWDEIPVSSSGKAPNITEETNSSEAPIYLWTNQAGPPYSIKNNLSCSQPCHGANINLAKLLEGGSTNPHPGVNLMHKRRAVVQHVPSGSSLILDVSPVKLGLANGGELLLPFKSHGFNEPINLSLKNIGDYIGAEKLSLPANAQNMQWKWEVSVPAGKDSTGNSTPNIFKGNYQVLLHIRDVNSPAISQTVNITNQPQLTLNIQAFAGRQIIIKPEPRLINMPKTDVSVGIGDLYYPVEGVLNNKMAITSGELGLIPKEFALKQNYPNPFNPRTTVAFDLPQNSFVKLEIYDISGRKVRTMVNQNMEAGRHQSVWDGRDEFKNHVASGVYFCRIQAGNFTAVNKMMLLR